MSDEEVCGETYDHDDCWQPHTGPDGEYYDCDGRPL